MIARQVMKRRVVTTTPETPLGDALRVLVEARVSALPVVDGRQRLVGMVGIEDLARSDAARPNWRQILAEPGLLMPRHTKVGDVMSRDVMTVEETTPIRTLIHLLARGPVKRLPVVTEGRLAGIVSRVDLLRALSADL